MANLKATPIADVDATGSLDTEIALDTLHHLHTCINTFSTSLMRLHTHLRYLIRVSDPCTPASPPSRGRSRVRPPPLFPPHPIASSPKRFYQASSFLTSIHLTLNKLEDLTARLLDHENEIVQCEWRIAECVVGAQEDRRRWGWWAVGRAGNAERGVVEWRRRLGVLVRECCGVVRWEVEEAGRGVKGVVGECMRFVGIWERELGLGVM